MLLVLRLYRIRLKLCVKEIVSRLQLLIILNKAPYLLRC
nr:MAG TPA: hypothetical protein [Bacteriophage sp.]DAT29075.1 MAG TPA: hypothetical protein [Caudoviricetes sp.]